MYLWIEKIQKLLFFIELGPKSSEFYCNLAKILTEKAKQNLQIEQGQESCKIWNKMGKDLKEESCDLSEMQNRRYLSHQNQTTSKS